MNIVKLSADDERIGTPDKKPKKDVLGNPHRGDILSTQSLGDGRYVILPMGLSAPTRAEIDSTPPQELKSPFSKKAAEGAG